MDELAVARAQLVLLEENERKLVDQLVDVRAAAAVQRKRIDELIRARPPLVQHLPVELLLSILHLALRGTNPSRKEILACVSRHWRDLILNQPSFWSTIEIDGMEKNLSRVREHIKKSREAPLDITIRFESASHHPNICKSLDLLLPCANRWRSFSFYSWDRPPKQMPRFIWDHIGAIRFPSLKHASLDAFTVIAFPTFLSPTNVPVLEHLQMRMDHYKLFSTPAFSNHIPVLTLVTLSLSGDVPPWSLQPDTVHFPVLETLKIDVENANAFFNAIVTPKLHSLDYGFNGDGPLSSIFGSLGGKFSSVRQVSVCVSATHSDTRDGLAFCRAFPHVCHADFYSRPQSLLSVFFSPCEGIDAFQSPVDYWTSLESVSLYGISSSDWLSSPIRESNPFVRWVVTRQAQQPLRVRIEDSVDDEEIEPFCTFYEILREYCDVELGWVSMTFDWTSVSLRPAGSRLQLHVPRFSPGLANDIGAVVGGIRGLGKSLSD